MGGEFGGEWIQAYVWLSPFAVHLKQSQHCYLAIFQYKRKEKVKKKKKTTSCKALHTKQRSLDLSNRPKLLKLGGGGLCPQECDMVCHSINKASLPRCPLKTTVLPNNKER